MEICGSGLAGLVSFDFPTEMISDLVVVSQEKLDAAVGSIVQANNLVAGPLLIVLSPEICFEKDIDRKPEVDLHKETQKFLDTIPLSSMTFKVFEEEKMYRVIAIGRELYEGLRNAFEKSGFIVKVVVPGYVLGAVGIKQEFGAEACQLVLKYMETISEHGFELERKGVETFSVQRTKFLNKHKIWVIVFFVISMAVLVIVAIVVTRKPAQRVTGQKQVLDKNK
jgi:hypothetical protein